VGGHPWAYSNEIEMDAGARLEADDGAFLADFGGWLRHGAAV